MASFVATYTGSTGQPRTLTVRAADLSEARKQLRRRGIRATDVKPSGNDTRGSEKKDAGGGMSFDLGRAFEKAPGVKEKAVFASKLAALVDAGVPIVRSLDLMATQQKLPMFKRALVRVSLDVNEGVALGTAIRKWPKVFDQLSVAMVEAGEAGGVLDESLKRLAKLLEDNAKLQNQIKGALGYPVAVLVIAILVFLGMTIFLIPTFAGIFEDLGAELPAFTQLLVDLSKLLRSVMALYIVGALLIAVWMFARYYQTHNGRRQVDRLMLKVPLFGELIMMTATAQFCRIFSSLTRAGVPILMSLEISSQTAGNSIISDAILESRALVQEGVLLSTALIRQKVLPDMALNMLSIGEETGEMDKMLSKVADFYEDEVSAMVKALTSMLEPAMIVVVGGIVGSILLAMYLPMFTVFDQIQ
ncbi:MAG: type II secretion system F family protein [Synechococcus sp. BS301-5m-G54]|uniref:type II secretion system F family protein n=1 Tax=Synechococcales TaxID=1890424 RepID=UPI0004E09034|nr:type II secretion system F family protein [Synechococcus sp. KORDI-49]MBL6740050.1 type II secretion system F family protein [Synechococcus sp. BS301-5m-G54]MBL6795193.1 type II secretion system F family protein [Synechococcus sp. BS307-5m-G34]OUW68604.1 MAG: pilus assembly protein PilC [Synechococcus sp. TMED205]RCL55852.1 MAG: type II secretion system F family protein [Synechococcus sp. MED-G70]HCX52845.1 type II secretion system F family protein [Synechococcus sp. UBA9887]